MAKTIKPRPMTDEQKAKAAKQDYGVGFGKPPTTSRFEPGTSGNPSGRPRGARSLRTIVHDAMAQAVTVNINGAPTRMTAKEAVAQRLVVQALTGKTQDAALFLQLIKQLLPEEFVAEVSDELSEDEATLMERAMNKALLARELAAKADE